MKREPSRSDDSRIGELIAAERAHLIALASRSLRDRERSEDLVQSTLVAALSSARHYRGTASVRPWQTTILKNRTVGDHRLRRRQVGACGVDLDGTGDPSATAADPSQELEARETAMILARRLSALPDVCSRAFVMR